MTTVWCSISAHGLGHAAQLMPILNELGTDISDLRVILRTQIPFEFFHRHLSVKWELQAARQDVGCIQRGPLDLDMAATWEAYAQFHADWERTVMEEAKAIQSANVNLVIANISYLAIASAAQVPCPVVGMASLSWDRVLELYREEHAASHRSILETIRNSYALAHRLIRLYPGIEMPAFPSIVDVGSSVPVLKANSYNLRNMLNIQDDERIVLVAFGGVPLAGLPLKEMESMPGFHFLAGDLPSSSTFSRVHRLEDLGIPFPEIMGLVDIIMTKPGYGTVTAAVHNKKPLVYVRRGNFIDEPCLVDYLHRYGRGVELPRKDFDSGDWEASLQKVLTIPDPAEPPPPPGHHDAVEILKTYLQA